MRTADRVPPSASDRTWSASTLLGFAECPKAQPPQLRCRRPPLLPHPPTLALSRLEAAVRVPPHPPRKKWCVTTCIYVKPRPPQLELVFDRGVHIVMGCA